jgi:hypothetical protein
LNAEADMKVQLPFVESTLPRCIVKMESIKRSRVKKFENYCSGGLTKNGVVNFLGYLF